MRSGEVTRKTKETDISLKLNIDGTGKNEVSTGIGFFDHMLELFAAHGRFDLAVSCKGDTHVDGHHTVEDVGICLGSAFSQAVGNAQGITRFGSITLPMDEALVMCAVDISGRNYLGLDMLLPECTLLTDMDAELFEEFMQAFTRKAGMTIHLRVLEGKNAHHIFEACFKALARSLRAAVKIDPDIAGEIPSTKGVI